MLQRFRRYCAAHRLHGHNSKWLVAVSGGIDSMTLAHLCYTNGIAMGVAHCNFGLRGDASDGDERFVAQWAQTRSIPFYSTRFDTKKYASANGISTQLAARDLRYAWFEQIRTLHSFTAIAVAHHADDNAETLLLNLTRGTGIKGLCGMSPVNGHIVRPLLFATRGDIAEYAAAHSIAFREDASNATTDYARNRIRKNVIPELEKTNPAAAANIVTTAGNLARAHRAMEAEKQKLEAAICTRTADETRIAIAGLKAAPCYDFWLFELLQPFHFSGTVADEIAQALDGQPGKRFFSASHELLKDRSHLIITPLTAASNGDKDDEDVWIPEHCEAIAHPLPLRFSRRQRDACFAIPRDKNTACLAMEKLQFPLQLRLWRSGDAFVPLGMQGVKKVSDFLIDEKASLREKAKQYVLLSGDNIAWLVGRRIDDRYKVTEQTRETLIIG
jgi:tRNA(Ile)-lysidine synthase